MEEGWKKKGSRLNSYLKLHKYYDKSTILSRSTTHSISCFHMNCCTYLHFLIIYLCPQIIFIFLLENRNTNLGSIAEMMRSGVTRTITIFYYAPLIGLYCIALFGST